MNTLSLFVSGAAEESRTLDLNLGKVALYQLSYCREIFCCFFGGATRNRTEVHGFAGRCITTLPSRLAVFSCLIRQWHRH